MSDQTTGTTSTTSPGPRTFDDIPYGAGAQPATASNTPFLTRVGYSIANYLDRTGRQAANNSNIFNPSRRGGLTRSPSNNGITTIPDLADINITHSLRRLEDSTTFFSVVPSFGDEESIISRREVQAAIEYRNTFKSGAPIADYVDFFKSIERKYFSNQFSLTLEGDPTIAPSLNDLSGLSNDSIFFWIKKYFAFPELTKFLSAPNAFYRSTWSRSTFNAIHLKFILERYQANTKSFFKSFSDSIGLMSNCKYHQLDSTQPIFDVSQDNYGVPIPFSANMENKVGPTARNLMYNLSRFNTTLMRHNLLQIAYYNSAYIKNMKVSSRVAHGCNLVNDIAFFVDFAKKTQTRVETVRTKFNAFNNKLFTFIQYISNIGNRSAMNLRDIYAPIDGYDKDFTVTPGSTTIAAQNVNEQTGQTIDAQLNELQQFALADQAISRRLYEDTARLRYLGDTRIIFDGSGSYDRVYGSGPAGITEPEGVFIETGNESPIEPDLPTNEPTVIEIENEDGTTSYQRSDTGKALTEAQARDWVIARDAAQARGKNEFDASIEADRVIFGQIGQPNQGLGVTQPNINRIGVRTDITDIQQGDNWNYARSTQFGYVNSPTSPGQLIRDTSDNQYGAVLRSTYGPQVAGASFSVAARAALGIPTQRDARNWNVEVTNGTTTIVVPIIDEGPAPFVEQRSGHTLDLTGAAHQMLGNNRYENINIAYRLVPKDPNTPIPTLEVSRPQEIAVNQNAGTAEIVSSQAFNQEIVSPEFTLAGNSVAGITATPAQQAAAINYASAASSRPYSNRQRMIPFAFQIRVEDIDGEEKLLTVDYLLKKVVQDNFNFYKRIDTLRVKKLRSDILEAFPIGPGSGGQTLDVYRERISQLAEYEWRNLFSSGNVNRVLAAAGIDPASSEYGQLYSVVDSVLKQNALTSQTLGQGFNALVGLGVDRIPTNILGSLTNGASIFDTVIGEINSIGGTPLPTIGGIVNSLNPFNYIDINISGIIPIVSLGSLDDIMGIAADLAASGPPTSIGDALDLAEQIKNIICEFEIPFISWPVLETLFKLKFNPKDIQKAIQKELTELGDRLAELFNPEKILQAIEQQIVSIFTTLYKRLFVCDTKSTTDASGQEDQGNIVR